VPSPEEAAGQNLRANGSARASPRNFLSFRGGGSGWGAVMRQTCVHASGQRSDPATGGGCLWRRAMPAAEVRVGTGCLAADPTLVSSLCCPGVGLSPDFDLRLVSPVLPRPSLDGRRRWGLT
jgi:hypothetical protein